MSDALPDGFIAIPQPAPAGAVLVGLSGGLDSCVLLHLLATQASMRARGLRAIHVHHGLQPDADAWAIHCQAFCDELEVPLQLVRVEVARDARRRAGSGGTRRTTTGFRGRTGRRTRSSHSRITATTRPRPS